MGLTFTIPGCAVPKQRPRKGSYGFYTPRRTVDYERKVAICAKQAGIKPIEGPIHLELTFYLPDRRRRDLDNLEKGVMDALNGVAWADDDQVMQKTSRKVRPDDNPRTEVLLHREQT